VNIVEMAKVKTMSEGKRNKKELTVSEALETDCSEGERYKYS
jgi:hypothetical protein